MEGSINKEKEGLRKGKKDKEKKSRIKKEKDR